MRLVYPFRPAPCLFARLRAPALVMAVLGAAGPVMAQGSGQPTDSDLPVFDLIFLDDAALPADPPPVVQIAPQIAAQRGAPPATRMAPERMQPNYSRATRGDFLAMADPATRLSSLPPPQPEMGARAPLPRVTGTDVTPPEASAPETSVPEPSAPELAPILVPAAVPPPDAPVAGVVPDPEPQLSPEELARSLQQELARVGCYRAGIDGDWGRGSRRALADYLARSDQTAEGQDPTPAILAMVRASPAEVCPPPPPPVAQPVRTSRPQPETRAAPAPARTPAPAQARTPAPAAPAATPPAASRLERGLTGGFR